MTKDIKQIQEENRKLILEAIHGVSYEEALKKEEEIEFANSLFCPTGVLIKEYVRPENYLKGLGKPITLSRVLLALEKRFCYFHLTGGKDFSLIEISVDTGKIEENGDPIYFEFNWDLQKETLEEQLTEVQIAINQLLTK